MIDEIKELKKQVEELKKEMNKDTKGNHIEINEDSLLQSKIRRPFGIEGSSPHTH